jgi:hypothetical protein
MTRVLLGSLAAVAAIALALSAQDPGKPKDDKPAVAKPSTLAEQIQRFDQLNRRGCGAKLALTKAELVSKKGVGGGAGGVGDRLHRTPPAAHHLQAEHGAGAAGPDLSVHPLRRRNTRCGQADVPRPC